MAKALDHVWQPGKIGPLELPHRIVMGSMHLGLEGLDDGGRALAAFYRERAEAGAALIVTGGSAVSAVGAAGRNYSFVNDDGDAEKLTAVAAAAHAGGARILLQLFHAGRYADQRAFGLTPVAPSAVYSHLSRCEPHAMSEEEIAQTIEDFATGAQRARELGFDGVEIMGSEGYLLNQFMAPATNLRDDAWGGDSERRMRFPVAVTGAVRDALGADGALVYRISAVDLVDGGATADEVRGLAGLLASGPADALSVGIGWHEARVPTVQASVPYGAWTPWARALREAVSVPVIAANRINTIELADAVLAGGDADFISMARPFLADPELVRKSRDGSGRRLNVCIACNQCIDRSIFDKRVSCAVNPRAGHESEPEAEVESESASRGGTAGRVGSVGAAGSGTRVAVVGGGPAGLEAARALAVAGYRVELFDAAPRLGGQFRMACRIPGKEDFAGTIAHFEQELDRLGVVIRLGAAVTDVATVAAFTAVVVATGVTPRALAVDGSELGHVRSYADVLLADDPVGSVGTGSVAIIGGGGIGVDIAHMLSSGGADGDRRQAFYGRYGLTVDGLGAGWPGDGDGRGDGGGRGDRDHVITVMRRHGRIGDGIGPSTRWVVVQELGQAGVTTLTGVEYERIEPGAVVITDADGRRQRVAADTVIVAAGQEPQTELLAKLQAAGRPCVAVGGAAGAAGLDAGRAFREGFEAPAAVALALAEAGARG